MHHRQRFPHIVVACALSLTIFGSAGCGARADGAVAVDETSVTGLRFPAPTYVTWQFFSCLDHDHSLGLALAMQNLANRDAQVRAVIGGISGGAPVGVSQCIDGEERGAVFSTSDVGDRGRALAAIAIRPADKLYAFATMWTLINGVTNYEFSTLAKRFGDDGKPSPNGRYQFTSLTSPFGGFATVDVVDTLYGGTIKAHADTWFVLTGTPPPNPAYNKVSIYPGTSSDPLIETVILATNKFLAGASDSDPAGNLFSLHGGPSVAFDTIALALEPTLQGWALPFDDIDLQDAYFLGTGGVVIQ